MSHGFRYRERVDSQNVAEKLLAYLSEFSVEWTGSGQMLNVSFRWCATVCPYLPLVWKDV